MIENVKHLYEAYGGIRAFSRSSYVWIAVILSLLSISTADSAGWVNITLSAMPSLTGFTVAAFALIFVVLDREMLKLLISPSKSGVSPILEVASKICHGVIVQVLAIIMSALYQSVSFSYIFKNVSIFECDVIYSAIIIAGEWGRFAISFVGMFLTYYGFLMVVAVILSVFRLLKIVAKAPPAKAPPSC